MGMLKKFLVVGGGVWLGEYVSAKFVVKDPNDPNSRGFVTASGGAFGVDDLAHLATVVAAIWLTTKFLGGKKG